LAGVVVLLGGGKGVDERMEPGKETEAEVARS